MVRMKGEDIGPWIRSRARQKCQLRKYFWKLTCHTWCLLSDVNLTVYWSCLVTCTGYIRGVVHGGPTVVVACVPCVSPCVLRINKRLIFSPKNFPDVLTNTHPSFQNYIMVQKCKTKSIYTCTWCDGKLKMSATYRYNKDYKSILLKIGTWVWSQMSSLRESQISNQMANVVKLQVRSQDLERHYNQIGHHQKFFQNCLKY